MTNNADGANGKMKITSMGAKNEWLMNYDANDDIDWLTCRNVVGVKGEKEISPFFSWQPTPLHILFRHQWSSNGRCRLRACRTRKPGPCLPVTSRSFHSSWWSSLGWYPGFYTRMSSAASIPTSAKPVADRERYTVYSWSLGVILVSSWPVVFIGNLDLLSWSALSCRLDPLF